MPAMQPCEPIFRVGVIADTHRLLRPEALDALEGCDWIIHAGDIGSPEVLEKLRGLAPVVAVRGNVDRGEWANDLPENNSLEIGELRIYVVHEVQALTINPATEGFQAVICGHSHRPYIREHNGVLYLNPGSAGPRRFTLPVCVAKLTVLGGALEPQLIYLNVSQGLGRKAAKGKSAKA